MASSKQEADERTSRAPPSADLASKFPPNFLEGVDFIETEEDAKAVEAATLKIQSTFRGKKFGRSKKSEPTNSSKNKATPTVDDDQKEQPAKCKDNDNDNDTDNDDVNTNTNTNTPSTTTDSGRKEELLSTRIGAMQVNDNEAPKCAGDTSGGGGPGASTAQLPGEEAERAATKIQAGFKGYKTRKELEGKLATSSTGCSETHAAGDNL